VVDEDVNLSEERNSIIVKKTEEQCPPATLFAEEQRPPITQKLAELYNNSYGGVKHS